MNWDTAIDWLATAFVVLISIFVGYGLAVLIWGPP